MQPTSRGQILLGVLVIAGTGAATLAQQSTSKQEGQPPAEAHAQAAKRPELLPEKGPGSPVFCQVEKGGMILSLLPDRTLVKKGDLVCELDASDLRDQLADLVIAVKRAEADHQNARLTHEVAEIAVREYVEGGYLHDKTTVMGEIKLAESDLVRAQDQVEQTLRMWEKGTASKARKVADELRLQKAKFALELSQSKLNLLENYAKAKTIKQLRTVVEKALTDELLNKEIWELRRTREEKTRRQIENCRIVAACDGRVVVSLRPPRPGEGHEPVPIQTGDIVRERQEIARVLPTAP
jgi:HlyD family secretion protein